MSKPNNENASIDLIEAEKLAQESAKAAEKAAQEAAEKAVQKTDKNPFAKKAKDVFSHHPAIEKVYFTTDGYPFIQKSDAELHARSLKNKEVVTINK